MSKPIIEVQDISKCYQLGAIGVTRLRDDLERTWDRFRGRTAKVDDHEFWALRDVSFEVQPSEIVGIIGRNGAGKSTLLKILSRITEPSSGEIIMRGRLASLLEVGTGFHGDLTGRENIFLNGAILGMTKTEIRSKLEEIIAFAEIEKFIDTPVKRYSSGMYVRLAFAVAAHLEPEILIVDEVLAVGDATFQKKCLGKMQEVSAKQGRTVIFVSHNMGVVASLCQKVFWLKGGRLVKSGPARAIVQEYLAANTGISSDSVDLDHLSRDGEFGERVRMIALEWLGNYPLVHGRATKFRIVCKAISTVDGISVGVGFSNLEGARLLTYDSDLTSETRFSLKAGQVASFDLEIPSLPTAPGIYLMDLGVRSGDMHGLDYLAGMAQIEVIAGSSTPGFIIRDGAGIRLTSSCTMQVL